MILGRRTSRRVASDRASRERARAAGAGAGAGNDETPTAGDAVGVSVALRAPSFGAAATDQARNISSTRSWSAGSVIPFAAASSFIRRLLA